MQKNIRKYFLIGSSFIMLGSFFLPFDNAFNLDSNLITQEVSAMTHNQEVRTTTVNYGDSWWVQAYKYDVNSGQTVLHSGYIHKIHTTWSFSKMTWEYTYSGQLRPGPIVQNSLPVDNK